MVHDKEHSTKEDFNGKSIFGWLGRLVLTASNFSNNIIFHTWF